MSSIDSVGITGTDGMEKAVSITGHLSDLYRSVHFQPIFAFPEQSEFLFPFPRDSSIRFDQKTVFINARWWVPWWIPQVFSVGRGTVRASRDAGSRVTTREDWLRDTDQKQEWLTKQLLLPLHHDGYDIMKTILWSTRPILDCIQKDENQLGWHLSADGEVVVCWLVGDRWWWSYGSTRVQSWCMCEHIYLGYI